MSLSDDLEELDRAWRELVRALLDGIARQIAWFRRCG